jgi:hypothetical protein
MTRLLRRRRLLLVRLWLALALARRLGPLARRLALVLALARRRLGRLARRLGRLKPPRHTDRIVCATLLARGRGQRWGGTTQVRELGTQWGAGQ